MANDFFFNSLSFSLAPSERKVVIFQISNLAKSPMLVPCFTFTVKQKVNTNCNYNSITKEKHTKRRKLTVSNTGPSRASIGTIKTGHVLPDILQLAKLGIFVCCWDAHFSVSCSCDCSVGFEVAAHGWSWVSEWMKGWFPVGSWSGLESLWLRYRLSAVCRWVFANGCVFPELRRFLGEHFSSFLPLSFSSSFALLCHEVSPLENHVGTMFQPSHEFMLTFKSI